MTSWRDLDWQPDDHTVELLIAGLFLSTVPLSYTVRRLPVAGNGGVQTDGRLSGANVLECGLSDLILPLSVSYTIQ